MKEKAWITFLSSNDYYIYLLINLYENLLDTKTKYPLYCAITKNVDESNINLLNTIGIKTILIDDYYFSDITIKQTDLIYYQNAFSKLAILGKKFEDMFDKFVYLDLDLWITDNIDELMGKPHMSAVINKSPQEIKPYKLGESVFCSGLFVWDFTSNKNLGESLLTSLNTLDSKIAWHDQSILNYWFKDWYQKQKLHLDYTYGLMNSLALHAQKQPKIWHLVNRIRNDWPFTRPVNLSPNMRHFREYCTEINKTLTWLYETYNIWLPLLNINNLKEA